MGGLREQRDRAAGNLPLHLFCFPELSAPLPPCLFSWRGNAEAKGKAISSPAQEPLPGSGAARPGWSGGQPAAGSLQPAPRRGRSQGTQCMSETTAPSCGQAVPAWRPLWLLRCASHRTTLLLLGARSVGCPQKAALPKGEVSVLDWIFYFKTIISVLSLLSS